MWIHFLTGVLIQSLIFNWLPISWGSWLLIILISFLSHFIIDVFSWICYHPHLPQKQDPFYRKEHLVVSILPAIVGIYFVFFRVDGFHLFGSLIDPECYFFAMLFAWFVDLIDWVFVRGLIHFNKLDKKYWDEGMFHGWINVFRKKIFPWIPDRRMIRSGWIVEFIVGAVLVVGIIIVKI
jgi:hypothetical protein